MSDEGLKTTNVRRAARRLQTRRLSDYRYCSLRAVSFSVGDSTCADRPRCEAAGIRREQFEGRPGRLHQPALAYGSSTRAGSGPFRAPAPGPSPAPSSVSRCVVGIWSMRPTTPRALLQHLPARWRTTRRSPARASSHRRTQSSRAAPGRPRPRRGAHRRRRGTSSAAHGRTLADSAGVGDARRLAPQERDAAAPPDRVGLGEECLQQRRRQPRRRHGDDHRRQRSGEPAPQSRRREGVRGRDQRNGEARGSQHLVCNRRMRRRKFDVRIRQERTVLNLEIDRDDVFTKPNAELRDGHVTFVF